MTKKNRRRKRTNNYFTKVHQDAIVEYALASTKKEKEELYVIIQPAFNELVDKIVFTYKFTNLPNIDVLREECKIALTLILDKFNPDKGSKAFSYFSVITKNWFIQQTKNTAKQSRRELQFEDAASEIEDSATIEPHTYINTREKKEFWNFLLQEINDWEWEEVENQKKKLYSNDLKVVKAIKMLFESPDDIDILNKKAIYLYLRELTGLNTKQIACSLKKFKIKYAEFRKEWESGQI